MKSKNLLIVIMLLHICFGCTKNDDEDALTNKKSYVIVELTGSLKNGSFKIERENLESNPSLAQGLMLPNVETNEEIAFLTFQDGNEDLTIGFVFPAKKGLNELLYDESEEYITIAFLNDGLVLVSKMVSLNINTFEKKENSFNGFGGTFIAKGTFTGTVVYIDVATNTEYSHILTGEFEYNPF